MKKSIKILSLINLYALCFPIFSCSSYKLTVTWMDYDGTILNSEIYTSSDDTPTYKGETPTRASDAQYTYTFSGWNEVESGKENQIFYVADYETTVNTYTITWKDYNDTVIEEDSGVAYGETPTYDSVTPARKMEGDTIYLFDHWDPEVTTVMGDATYTAVYSETKITYNISFDLNGGTSEEYNGSKTVSTFTKDVFFFDCKKEGYKFRGWSYEGKRVFDENGNKVSNPTLAQNMVFVAIFTQTSILTVTKNINAAGTIFGEGEYSYNSSVDLSVYVRDGYIFEGWYLNDSLLSTSVAYNYMIWDEDVTLEARFKLGTFSLDITTNNEEKGLVIIKSKDIVNYDKEYSFNYDYLTDITIAAYTKGDSKFLGWYDDSNNLISSDLVYSFKMPSLNYHLEAKWDYFKINYELDGGTNNSLNPDYYTSESGVINLSSPTKKGYDFKNWTSNGKAIYSIDSSLLKDMTLQANWAVRDYKIIYNLNGGVNNPLNQDTYNIESGDVNLFEPTRDGYTFKGWFLGSKQYTTISHDAATDINLYAKWETVLNNLTLESEDESKGVVSLISGSGYTGENMVVKAEPINDCIFKGWYVGDIKVSNDEEYSFVMGTNNLVLEARFNTLDEEAAFQKKTCISPVLSEDKKSVLYGLYPQTNVNDENLISILDTLTVKESNGYYLYNDEFYTKIEANPYSKYACFDNGNSIVSGASYWFKCEPISWTVYNSAEGKYDLVSNTLLDVKQYDDDKNNYAESDIRNWLNEDFYNTAFAFNNTYVSTTLVDNSGASTDSEDNAYASINTNDKVYLLSYVDYTSYFADDSLRKAKTSDYCRARGADYDLSGSTQNYGTYWTRSPSNFYFLFQNTIDINGAIDNGSVTYENYSVRPAISINLN